MSHAFARNSSSAVSVTKRVIVGATLVVVGYLAAVLAPPTVGIGGVTFGIAAPVQHLSAAVAARTAAAMQRNAAGGGPLRRDFDYFPDHYTNQATEVEEPIATF